MFFRRHVNIHTKPFVCSKCISTDGTGKMVGFGSRGDLKRHMREKHSRSAWLERMVYKCHGHGCNRAFARKSNVKPHFERIHVPLGEVFDKKFVKEVVESKLPDGCFVSSRKRTGFEGVDADGFVVRRRLYRGGLKSISEDRVWLDGEREV